ncbi:nitroreductase family protein [Sunxiuqinia sp. sy24]|uniref:nitroreductase family protein n=1 Tax=Sunxiuqinia sp. sy24 TaxID=3461495 RepID=UPI0040465BEF
MKSESEPKNELKTATAKERHFQEIIETRWSPRSFLDQRIPDETIFKLFDAGKTIMSCFNEQPWRVIFASKEDEHYAKLFDCLGEFNQKWVQTAPCLGVVLGKKHFTRNDKVNRHHLYDSGAFMATTTLMAASLDLFVHQMAGFSSEKVMEYFQIPNDYVPAAMFVIGKLGDPRQLPKEFEEKELQSSPRNGVDQFLFGAQWGTPYKLKKGDINL